MKQEVEFLRNEDIPINQKEVNGFLYPIGKPSENSIKELREQKRRIRESWNEEIEINKDEQETALSFTCWNCNSKKREQDINATIGKIKELQLKKGITEFSRDFLNILLKHYTGLQERVREKKIKEILSRAIKRTDRQVKKIRLHKEGCYISNKEVYYIEESFYSFI